MKSATAEKVSVFGAIADPSRRRILELLKDGEKTAGDLAGQFTFSWPALSQHLGVLKRYRINAILGHHRMRLALRTMNVKLFLEKVVYSRVKRKSWHRRTSHTKS